MSKQHKCPYAFTARTRKAMTDYILAHDLYEGCLTWNVKVRYYVAPATSGF